MSVPSLRSAGGRRVRLVGDGVVTSWLFPIALVIAGLVVCRNSMSAQVGS